MLAVFLIIGVVAAIAIGSEHVGWTTTLILLFWTLTTWLLVTLAPTKPAAPRPAPDPLEPFKQQYAIGKITLDEYEQIADEILRHGHYGATQYTVSPRP